MTHDEYLNAAEFWNIKDSAGKKAAPAEIIAAAERIILANKNCALATGYGGYVRCTPVDYTYHDGAFWVFTEGGMKFFSLADNKQVSLAIWEKNGTFGNLQGVQVMGTADTVEPFSDEYNKNAELRKIPLTALKNLKSPMYLIKIVPSEMIVLDSGFKTQGFDSRQIWRAE